MELLFSKIDLYSVETNQIEKAKGAARAIPESRLKTADDDALTKGIIEKFAMEVPTVDWDQASVSRKEVQVDLMHQHGTRAFYQGRSVPASGEKVTVTVPYAGDGEYFRIRPSSYTMNPPRAKISPMSLLFEYQGQQVNIEQAKREYENVKAEITKYLATLANDLRSANEKLAAGIRPIVQEKRKRMEHGEANLAGFGLPIK